MLSPEAVSSVTHMSIKDALAVVRQALSTSVACRRGLFGRPIPNHAPRDLAGLERRLASTETRVEGRLKAQENAIAQMQRTLDRLATSVEKLHRQR